MVKLSVWKIDLLKSVVSLNFEVLFSVQHIFQHLGVSDHELEHSVLLRSRRTLLTTQ